MYLSNSSVSEGIVLSLLKETLMVETNSHIRMIFKGSNLVILCWLNTVLYGIQMLSKATKIQLENVCSLTHRCKEIKALQVLVSLACGP